MIKCVFTIDYEIFGNGKGSLKEFVLEPADKLKAVFIAENKRCVIFTEAAEMEIIGLTRTDKSIDLVEEQVKAFHRDGFEIGLHLHPQWYKAHFMDAHWHLDYDEYNLCQLPPSRIEHIISRSIAYLRRILEAPEYTPFSFRAGNWLMQPSGAVAGCLSQHGIKIDSSVYKGGLQRRQHLDYRRSRKNGYYWRFSEDINHPDPNGLLLEIPTFTKMVPIWKFLTFKRLGLEQQRPTEFRNITAYRSRLCDFARPLLPVKLDFCRLSLMEMIRIFEAEIERDRRKPEFLRPIVAIGHTKDLVDLAVLKSFLAYLIDNNISVTTFKDLYIEIAKSN